MVIAGRGGHAAGAGDGDFGGAAVGVAALSGGEVSGGRGWVSTGGCQRIADRSRAGCQVSLAAKAVGLVGILHLPAVLLGYNLILL